MELQTKLGPKSHRATFLGYPDGVKGYRLRNSVSNVIFVARDVIFDEDLLITSDDNDDEDLLITSDDNDDDNSTPPSSLPSTPVSQTTVAAVPVAAPAFTAVLPDPHPR
jgi:hypothetical protein